MNDFTKEELEELCFFTELHKNRYRLKYPEELLNKLQYMIKNYCRHEKMEYIGDVYGYSCRKCEKQFTRQVIDGDRHFRIITGKDGAEYEEDKK